MTVHDRRARAEGVEQLGGGTELPERRDARRRVALAQELLETTDASVEQVAHRCCWGTATTLRRRLREAVGVSPSAYRPTSGTG